ncbi:MAG: nitrogen regulation protein NR(II) [Thioalkalispiraceae bacterium]
MTPQYDTQNRILENLNTTVMLFNSALKLEYINPAGEMLFAASARQLIDSPLTSLLQTETAIEHEFQQALLSDHPFTLHEINIMLPQGDEITIDLTVIPLKEPDQPPAVLVELIQLNRLLRISRDESRATQQVATREILRGLAHEVKNPLGGLRGAAQLLEKQLDSEELREYTRVIIDEADRLQALVNRILGPTGLTHKQTVNIHSVLERVRSVMLAETHHTVKIHRDYDPSIPEIEADSDQLIQAILNIVRNAYQAVGEGGNITLRTRIARRFTIGQQHYKLIAHIEIIDDGPGIPEDIIEKIFLPMVTGHAEGTGLGLSIAQSLIQQHDGLIECQSEPGRTVFSILLPIDEGE